MLHDDHFEEEFEVFKESSFFEQLAKKFTPLPYYKKYRRIQQLVWIASYLFNVISAMTATSMIYLFTYAMTENQYVALGVSILAVVLLEMMKRKLSGLVFKEWLVAQKYYLFSLGILILLSGLSIVSSYYGAKQIVVEWSSEAPLKVKDYSTLEDELANLDTQIEEARNTTWKGVTTEESQATIQSLSEQRTTVLAELMRQQQQQDLDDRTTIAKHESLVQFQAKHFALVTLLLELLFWMAAFYLEFYDYKSYTQFHKSILTPSTKKVTTVATTTPAIPSNTLEDSLAIDPSILQEAIKNAKANLSAYKSKLKNGQGTVTANNRGIRRWEKRLRELEELLPDKIRDNTKEIIPDKGSDNGQITTLF